MYTIDINGFTVNVKKDPNGVVLGLNNSLYFSLVKPGNILRLEEGKWLLMDTSKMTHAMKPKDFLDKASLDLSELITEYKVGGRNLHLEYDEMFFFQALIYDLITDANMDWLRGKNIKFGEYYVEVKDDNSKISYYEYPRTFQTMEEFVSPPSASQPSIKNFMISKGSPTLPIPTPKVSPALPIPKVPSSIPKVPPTIPSSAPKLPPTIPSPAPKLPPTIPSPAPKLPPTIPSPAPKLPPTIPSSAPKLPPTIPSLAPKLPPTIPSPAPKLPPTIPSPVPKIPPTIPSPAPKLPPAVPSSAPKLPPTIPSPAPKLPPTIPSPAPKLPPTIPSPAPKLPPAVPSSAPKLPPAVPSLAPKPSLPVPTPKLPLPVPSPVPKASLPVKSSTSKLPLPVPISKVPIVPVIASPGEEEGPFALYKRLANMTEEERKRDMELNPTAYIKGRHYMEITTEEMTDDSVDTTE